MGADLYWMEKQQRESFHMEAAFTLFQKICYLANKHEVQYWLDCPGTDEQKLRAILTEAREGLQLFPEHWRNNANYSWSTDSPRQCFPSLGAVGGNQGREEEGGSPAEGAR